MWRLFLFRIRELSRIFYIYEKIKLKLIIWRIQFAYKMHFEIRECTYVWNPLSKSCLGYKPTGGNFMENIFFLYRETPGSNLAGIVPNNRPRPLPCTSFPIFTHQSSYYSNVYNLNQGFRNLSEQRDAYRVVILWRTNRIRYKIFFEFLVEQKRNVVNSCIPMNFEIKII
jgi:hypothetical protein